MILKPRINPLAEWIDLSITTNLEWKVETNKLLLIQLANYTWGRNNWGGQKLRRITEVYNNSYSNKVEPSTGIRNWNGSSQIIITIIICTELFTKCHGIYYHISPSQKPQNIGFLHFAYKVKEIQELKECV